MSKITFYFSRFFLVVSLVFSFFNCTSCSLYKEVHKNCSDGCTEKGNCNIEDGSCECKFGFAGPTCNIGLLSACQVQEDTEPLTGFFLPKSCTCFEQLMSFFNCNDRACSSTIYLNTENGRCYKYENGTDFTYSSLPDKDTPGLKWYSRRGIKRGKYTQIPAQDAYIGSHYYYRNATIRHFTACPENCTFRGACVVENGSPNCRCMQGYAGRGCERVDESLCANKCSGRGTCNRGFCHCEPPWFGMDCSRSRAFEPVGDPAVAPINRIPLPPRDKILVYMYELPSHVAFTVANDEVMDDRPPNYLAFEYFRAKFLTDWTRRTENPYEAHLFYIPASMYMYTSNTPNPAFQLRTVIDYVRMNYPFFNRSAGRDHFVWMPADKGACHVELKPELDNVMKVVHFGLHMNAHIDNTSVAVPDKIFNSYEGCLNPLKDVLTASHTGLDVNASREAFRQIARTDGRSKRQYLFFFAGSLRLHQEAYSGGVRQMIFKMVEKRYKNDTTISVSNGRVPNYLGMTMHSTFCLAPYGSGYGVRFYWAVAYGCIPVIIQDHVLQPYEGILPYHKFSVRMRKDEIPHMIEHLKGYDEERIASMRMNLLKYHKAFIWDPLLEGQAYNYTMHTLFNQVQNYWGNVYRRRSSNRRQARSLRLFNR